MPATKTPFCEECSTPLATRIAMLPPDDRAAIIEAVERLVETYASLAGVVFHDETNLPANVVRLRIPPKAQ